MTEKYLVGIDIGSSFTKSSIYDIEGNSLGAAKRDTHPDQPRPNVAEYDGPKLLQAILDSLKELVAHSGVSPQAVAGICLDGMISGTMGIAADGEATTPYTTTLDLRFTPQLNFVLDQYHDPIRAQHQLFAP